MFYSWLFKIVCSAVRYTTTQFATFITSLMVSRAKITEYVCVCGGEGGGGLGCI